MKLQPTASMIAMVADRFVWMIGMMVIMGFCWDHWPGYSSGALIISIAVAGSFYTWNFFLHPLLAELRL